MHTILTVSVAADTVFFFYTNGSSIPPDQHPKYALSLNYFLQK